MESFEDYAAKVDDEDISLEELREFYFLDSLLDKLYDVHDFFKGNARAQSCIANLATTLEYDHYY